MSAYTQQLMLKPLKRLWIEQHFQSICGHSSAALHITVSESVHVFHIFYGKFILSILLFILFNESAQSQNVCSMQLLLYSSRLMAQLSHCTYFVALISLKLYKKLESAKLLAHTMPSLDARIIALSMWSFWLRSWLLCDDFFC